MLGLEKVIEAGQKSGRFFREDDVQSLLRLNRLPVEEVEKRAKRKGLWHPKCDGKTPVAGDLVTFDVGNDKPHVAYVTGSDSDGNLRVRSESPLRGGKAQDRPDNAMDEEFTLNHSEIRGTISKPSAQSDFVASMIDDFFPPLGLLGAHQHFQNIVTELLDPNGGKR